MAEETARIQFTLQFEKKIKAWVLVPGGWFPIHFPSVDILVVDRNVTSALAAFEANPNRPDLDADKWWLQHLNRASPLLNPILCALEGRWKAPPSFDQFKDELNSSGAILRRTLPEARILEHREEDLHVAYQICISQVPRMQREMAFLVAVCPKLTSRIASGKELGLEAYLFSEADKFDVDSKSLCFIAALSVLYEKCDGSEPRIGRGVLKPKPLYTEHDAYNAIADLHSLEMLAAGRALPGPSIGLCTRDKYLAAFWTCLGAHSGFWDGNSFTSSFTLKPDLFPRLTEDSFLALIARIKGED